MKYFVNMLQHNIFCFAEVNYVQYHAYTKGKNCNDYLMPITSLGLLRREHRWFQSLDVQKAIYIYISEILLIYKSYVKVIVLYLIGIRIY